MPRKATPKNAAGTAATARWRNGIRQAKRPEVDAVDRAISAAVSAYLFAAQCAGSAKDIGRVKALEVLAVDYLTSLTTDSKERKYDQKEARRSVHRRLRTDFKKGILALSDNVDFPARPPVTP